MTIRLPHPLTAPIPGYYSKTAYSIPLDQADAIVRVSAYHRKDFDRAVTWFPPRTHSNVITSLSSAFHEPTTSLGDFLSNSSTKSVYIWTFYHSLSCARSTLEHGMWSMHFTNTSSLLNTPLTPCVRYCVHIQPRALHYWIFTVFSARRAVRSVKTSTAILSSYPLGFDVARIVFGAVLLDSASHPLLASS